MSELSLFQSIRERRTTKDFDGSRIDRSQIEILLDLANLAPNHRLNYPWRFFVLLQAAIPGFLEKIKPQLSDTERTLSQKYFDKLPKAGAVIFVGTLKNSDPLVQGENLAAVSAAIQNMLLAATSQGVSSFWSTGKFFSLPTTLKMIGWSEDLNFVGSIWLGKASKAESKPRRPVSDFTTWVSS